MKYSTTHLRLSNNLNSPDVLTDPQDFLGPNYKTVLNFWTYLDSLSSEQLTRVGEIALSAQIDWDNFIEIRDEAESTIGLDFLVSVCEVNCSDIVEHLDEYITEAISMATEEIIGMHKIFEKNNSLLYVPMFDFNGNYELHSLNVEDIESRIQRINDFIGPKVEVENSVSMTEEDLKSFIEDVELFD